MTVPKRKYLIKQVALDLSDPKGVVLEVEDYWVLQQVIPAPNSPGDCILVLAGGEDEEADGAILFNRKPKPKKPKKP